MEVSAPKEDPAAAAARQAEEERIKVANAKADASEISSTKRLQDQKTKQVLRLFGNANAMAALGGLGGVASVASAAPSSAAPAPNLGGTFSPARLAALRGQFSSGL